MDDIASLYPSDAQRLNIWGRAVLGCTVDRAGLLQDCAVQSETPNAMGFGAAASALAGKFQMASLALDGRPVEGAKVTVPVRFITGKPPFDLALGCYAVAKATAESTPANITAWRDTVGWMAPLTRYFIERKAKPSEMDARMAEAVKAQVAGVATPPDPLDCDAYAKIAWRNFALPWTSRLR